MNGTTILTQNLKVISVFRNGLSVTASVRSPKKNSCYLCCHLWQPPVDILYVGYDNNNKWTILRLIIVRKYYKRGVFGIFFTLDNLIHFGSTYCAYCVKDVEKKKNEDRCEVLMIGDARCDIRRNLIEPFSIRKNLCGSKFCGRKIFFGSGRAKIRHVRRAVLLVTRRFYARSCGINLLVCTSNAGVAVGAVLYSILYSRSDHQHSCTVQYITTCTSTKSLRTFSIFCGNVFCF